MRFEVTQWGSREWRVAFKGREIIRVIRSSNNTAHMLLVCADRTLLIGTLSGKAEAAGLEAAIDNAWQPPRSPSDTQSIEALLRALE